MQDCFRLHPEIYASELADDEDEEAPSGAADSVPQPATEAAKEVAEVPAEEVQPVKLAPAEPLAPSSAPKTDLDETTKRLIEAEDKDPRKRAFDATDANKSE